MNRIVVALFAAALLWGNLQAQTQPTPGGNMPAESKAPAATQTAPAPAVATTAPPAGPGSVIAVQLTKSIDAKKAKNGDEVVAKVTQDVRDAAGTVLVSKDTKIVGHITGAQPRSKEQKESQLAIAFDHLALKNGETIQMSMSIQAIIAAPGSANAQDPSPTNSSAAEGRAGGNVAPGIPPTGTMPTSGSPQPVITSNTKGIVGIANLNLSSSSDAKQGSVVTSEKNNVKLEDGTLMLLRVN